MKATKFFALLCAITWLTTSCDKENSYNPNNPTNNESVMVTKNAITGIWKVYNTSSDRSSQNRYYNSFNDFYLCFEDDGTYNYYFETVTGPENYHIGEADGTTYYCRLFGKWNVVNNNFQMNKLRCMYLYENGHYLSANVTGSESLSTQIVYKLTSNEFDFLDNGGSVFYATKVYSLPSKYNTLRSYDPYGSGGGGSSQGVTDLYLYDYTEWPTKIKVVYKYESDLPVTSAKIYYGEYSASTSVSATVSSSTITATISGLKKNTVYYVKASATTSKGTVTSSESRVMTAIE